MKTINRGNGDWRPWWVGKTMKCEECGQIIELEAGDENLANWMPTIDDSVCIRCERCGNTVTLKKLKQNPPRPLATPPMERIQDKKEAEKCESEQ